MFCPNCGKDCGSAKFCASCGAKVQQVVESKSQTSEWKIGMPCPHCGGLQLNGNNCAFCGAQLEEDTSHQKDQCMDIPYGVYRCCDGYLELKKDVLIIKKKNTHEISIPYTSIVKVKYVPMTRFKFGYFSIRRETDSEKPFPDSYREAIFDDATVLYYDRDEETFQLIYRALLVNFCEE